MEKQSKKNQQATTVHIPVLLQNVITVLAVKPTDTVVDGTLGGGGHATHILEKLGPNGMYLGIDADDTALTRVRKLLGRDKRMHFALGNFRTMDTLIQEAGINQVHKILLDLGLSSDQLETQSGRGFSFMVDEPLKMTFAHARDLHTLTAWHVVNEWSEESLADIIFGFGEEKRSRRIARAIVEARQTKSIETSKELAAIVEQATPRRSGAHPATRTFQAIRIAVNDELGALGEVLSKSLKILAPGGRIAIISFHSLEDRIVKRAFIEWEKEGLGERITKRPIVPSRKECIENRRSRSAKLRCFMKAE
ncbi:MAG: Ribosomal RNA small subunit methyltransferase H [Parcubacteria group bacterium GW2011_GWA2_43_11]|nr:MAG: Ribosomal RNA small subunit methyltransferase H [Parcubacteria group bacterium GW2011_GWC2_42_11]KKS86268.1 MAG: Ribosomal RNA small subunit methyltransferase H [Parcubacteria group bacterium GW2011_GWA2_43_11]